MQQLFPSFPQATIEGDTYRVERCISCHVPDIGTIGPVQAAKRLSRRLPQVRAERQAADQRIPPDPHPSGVHQRDRGQLPAVHELPDVRADGVHLLHVHALHPARCGAGQGGDRASSPGRCPRSWTRRPTTGSAGSATGPLGIDQVGCIVCHNGNRLGLDETDAHQNLIVNPEYSFTEGAQLYYQNCARCHGGQGEGGAGPPLNNQDRLGYFNEDYYYRCIEYGFTDFEHYGSIMPNWGGIAS